MSSEAFYILADDRLWAEKRIAELEQSILDLGPEFNVALNQSTETWHDNAPFDELRERQALMASEMQQLKRILRIATVELPKPTNKQVQIGTRVQISHLDKTTKLFLVAGHWSARAGQVENDAMVITYASPIGQALIGKKLGDVLTYGPRAISAQIVDLS